MNIIDEDELLDSIWQQKKPVESSSKKKKQKNQKNIESDKIKNKNEDVSPPRKSKDLSPPRNRDLSPLRKETVYRDEKGRILTKEEIEKIKKQNEDIKNKVPEKQKELEQSWNRLSSRQKQIILERQLEKEREKEKEKEQKEVTISGRGKDSKEWNEQRKKIEHWDDPFRKKKVCKYPAPINRFNIEPGWQWDGVDRSNGFEMKYLKRKNEIESRNQNRYKMATEDM